MSGRARIMVVDDHPIMREGLVQVIGETADLMVGAQAGDMAEARRVIDSDVPLDLVIVDISLGTQNGLELIKDMKAYRPETPVLVHSMHDEEIYAHRSLRAGARGYLMKHEPPGKLLAAIRHVLSGEVYLSEKMTRRMMRQLVDPGSSRAGSAVDHLSDRELEVFEQLGLGRKTRDIAEDLNLSVKTVQTYCAHLKKKLHLKDAASLVRFAVQWMEAHR